MDNREWMIEHLHALASTCWSEANNLQARENSDGDVLGSEALKTAQLVNQGAYHVCERAMRILADNLHDEILEMRGVRQNAERLEAEKAALVERVEQLTDTPQN